MANRVVDYRGELESRHGLLRCTPSKDLGRYVADTGAWQPSTAAELVVDSRPQPASRSDGDSDCDVRQSDRDAELIAAVREGGVAAYGELYERHVGAAYALARQLARSTAGQDDLVSEAFVKVLDMLRDGRGPDSAFRAYLLTALRRTAYDKTRRDGRVELVEDVSTIAQPTMIGLPLLDTALAELERGLAAKAFARLPKRWQEVLWHVEIDCNTPTELAPRLGLTANSVSALAYRAREGLRQAYLQLHLAETDNEPCKLVVARLGAWARNGLSKREARGVDEHLDTCDACRARSVEVAELSTAFRIGRTPKRSRGRNGKARQACGSQHSMMRQTGYSFISMKLAS